MLPFVFDGREIAQGRVAARRIVEAFDELKDRHPRLAVGPEATPIDQLAFEGGEETLAHRIVVGVADRACRWTNAGFLAASAESDRRVLGGFKWSSQHLEGVAMNIRKRRSDRFGRVRLFSPGRPPVAGREERRRFWAAIAAGTASEDAAVGVGVPQAVGTRWFRKAGGMPPSMFGLSAKPLSGRYLSFAEREEIALLRVQGYSMQEVARRLGRVASTISRELRRNAAHRRGGWADAGESDVAENEG